MVNNANSIQNENEQKAYEMIFRALSAGSDIKITDKHIYFSSNDLSSEQVEMLFTKPKDFKSAVGKYVFIPENINHSQMLNSDSEFGSLLSRSQIPALPSNFLEALFSKKILQESNLDNLNDNSIQEVDGNFVLNIEDYEHTQYIWEARINMLKKVLQIAGPEGVAEAFKNGKTIKLGKGEIIESDVSKNINSIIGVKVTESTPGAKQAIFYLNKEYLMNTVLAPEVVKILPRLEGDNSYKHTSQIDKKQFNDFLGKVFGDVVVPAQDLQKNSFFGSANFVQPVIVPRAITNSIQKQNIYSFVIDTSGSLSYVQNTYKKQLSDIAKQLIQTIKDNSNGYINSQDLIRIVLFDTQIIFKDFPVAQVLLDNTNLINFIENANIGGGTLLHGTVTEQIDQMLKLCSSSACNANMLIFSDGADTDSTYQQKDSLEAQGNKFREQKSEIIPKFHIFRVGDADVPKIEEISTGIDAQVYDIHNFAGLARVFQDIKGLELHRDLIQLVQEQQVTSIPVFENQLTIGPKIDITKDIKFNGVAYTIQASASYDPNLVNKISLLDSLNKLEERCSALDKHMRAKILELSINKKSKYVNRYFSYLDDCQYDIEKHKLLLSDGNKYRKYGIPNFVDIAEDIVDLTEELGQFTDKFNYVIDQYAKAIHRDPANLSALDLDATYQHIIQATAAETARVAAGAGLLLPGYNSQCPAVQFSMLPDSIMCPVSAGSSLMLGK
jgi:hypothetical protein